MQKHLILIAEDDADDRYLLQTAFAETGFIQKVEFVENGVELLNFLESITGDDLENKYPKFIMLDLNMPKMDGREVLRKIKTNEKLKKIPVIIFSTTKNQLEVKRCYDLGANTYIVKPVSFERLVETFREIQTYWFKTATLVDTIN